jgi:predicted glycosyltransferase
MTGRILLHVQHLLGVGHVRRAAVIARALAASGFEVTVALGGPPDPLADFGAARPHALPSARAADMRFSALMDADGRPVDDAWWARRTAATLDLHAQLAPDVLVIEHFPFGRRAFARELVPLLERHRAQGRGPVLCSLRDVLVEKPKPASIARTLDLVRSWFDAVLVHGDPGVLALAATFPAAAEIAERIHYTGYVVDAARSAVAPGGDGEGEIVVSVGGGAVGERLLEVALAAGAGEAASGRRWRLLAGAGLPEGVFRRLQTAAGHTPNVSLEVARADFRALLGRAAASVSQAGYNTLMDLMVTGCPAVVVPFVGDGSESEQIVRAREFERRGLLAVVPEDRLDAATLSAAVAGAVAAGRRPAQGIRLDGAQTTAALVGTLLSRHRGASS